MVLDDTDQRLIGAIQGGLPLVPRPYQALALRLGLTEEEVLKRVGALLGAGTIKRFGVVVRHHELGYRANAMVVWDVADERVAEAGKRLGAIDCVTLCYRRPRRLPAWPYNLFCMVHGRSRDAVVEKVESAAFVTGLDDVPREILFSSRRYKQRGALYVSAPLGDLSRRLAHG